MSSNINNDEQAVFTPEDLEELVCEYQRWLAVLKTYVNVIMGVHCADEAAAVYADIQDVQERLDSLITDINHIGQFLCYGEEDSTTINTINEMVAQVEDYTPETCQAKAVLVKLLLLDVSEVLEHPETTAPMDVDIEAIERFANGDKD